MFKVFFLHVLFCLYLQGKVFAEDSCKETIRGNSGVIKTKGFPKSYPSESDCVWLISVDAGSYVSLEFGIFDVEGEGKECVDIVEIKDGQDVNAPLIGGYCNIRRPPAVITSSSNNLRVWFSSDKTENYKGFNASYKALKEPGCGPTNLVGTEGTLKTPRFPNFYPNNVKCEWFITVPEGMFVRLTFLGYAMSCEDSLEVWDWKSDIRTSHGKYCLTLPQLIVSKSNAMKIGFTSDEEKRFRGFQAFYTTSLTPGCGGDLTGEGGAILSPNHPYVYPAYSNCVWRLRVPQDRYISLRFTQFDILSTSKKCFYDAVEVRDGYSKSSPLLGRFCNSNLPPIISVDGRELFVQFSTGPGVTRGYFRATFLAHKSGCTESLGIASGDYRVNDNQLTASTYNFITLMNNQVVNFLPQSGRLYGSLAWCSKPVKRNLIQEYFQITFPSIMNITGVATQGHYFQPIGHTAYVQKYAMMYRYNNSFYWVPYVDKTVYGSGVNYKVINANNDTNSVVRVNLQPSILAKEIRIYATEWYSDLSSPTICLRTEVYGCEYSLGCGRIFSADTAGMISSRDPRPHGSRCTWLSIPSPINAVNMRNALLMTFTYFDVNCGAGKLTVTNRMTSDQEEFCGQDKPDVLIMRPTDPLKIDKITISTSSSIGFTVVYRKEFLGSCGQLINVGDEVGNLTSPNYPQNYGNLRNCTWILMAKKNHRIQLEFDMFLLQAKNGTTCLDFLEIKDGPLASSNLVNKYCGNGIPSTVTSSGRYLRVSFITDNYIDEKGFAAFYSSIEPVDVPVVGAQKSGLRGGAIAYIVIFVIFFVLLLIDLACCHFNKCGLIHMLTEKEKQREEYQQTATDENKNNTMASNIPRIETAEAETETSDLSQEGTNSNVYVNVEEQGTIQQPNDSSNPPELANEAAVTVTDDGYEDVSLEVPDDANDGTPQKEKKNVSFSDVVEVAAEPEQKEEFESAPTTPNLSLLRDSKTEESPEKERKPSNLDIV